MKTTFSKCDNRLFLASSSPRRKELLQQLNVDFEVINAPIEEVALPNESPESYVLRMAIEKALSGFNKVAGKQIWVVGSDTAVVLHGKVFGKPKNAADAFAMLSQLSGTEHEVLSGVAVVFDGEVFSAMSKTRVQFKVMSQVEIEAYIATEESFGKAGSYAIQGVGAKFISHIHGSYSGVMGLPLFELNRLLTEASYYQLA
ncbi:Septum formation protein Maf [hydrothermal vent metagenome]|uniref:Septum formation protein Maf n=1 Tax=hydrothermal vent metagenome TaxID=652676 RepID=A0A3B0WWS1_9ZZZZ